MCLLFLFAFVYNTLSVNIAIVRHIPNTAVKRRGMQGLSVGHKKEKNKKEKKNRGQRGLGSNNQKNPEI